MHLPGTHNYYVYILTTFEKKVLYIGVTNDLERRILEHQQDASGAKTTFCGKYNCYYLVYWEYHRDIRAAIEREKYIKGWKRDKKIELINSFNPDWKFLNESYHPG